MKSTGKRLVLHHSTGRLAGLSQILGVSPSAGDYPVSLNYGVQSDPKEARHIATKPRMVAYREFTLAATGRLNEFNPAQR